MYKLSPVPNRDSQWWEPQWSNVGGWEGEFVPCRTPMGEKLASIINGSRLQGEMDQMWLSVELLPEKHELFVVHLASLSFSFSLNVFFHTVGYNLILKTAQLVSPQRPEEIRHHMER